MHKSNLILKSDYIMRDSPFGIWIQLTDMFKGKISKIRLDVIDIKEKTIFSQIMLPHQLYYWKLKEIILNHDKEIISVRVTPLMDSIELLSKED